MNVPEAPEDPPIPEPTGQDVDAAGMRGGFPDIGALAPLGDGLSAALVGPDAAVEFFCPLRFDAPALVFPVLDRRRGGRGLLGYGRGGGLLGQGPGGGRRGRGWRGRRFRASARHAVRCGPG